jgi:molybdate transport system regulatory protein
MTFSAREVRRIAMTQVSVTFRVDFGPHCAIGPGKIALLENIDSSGSLSEAARILKMSYRRAWLLLEDVNTSFQQPAAQLSVGGRGGGGASLTPFGAELLLAYRAFEAHIRQKAQPAFPPTAQPAAGEPRARRSVPKRRVSRGSNTMSSRPGRSRTPK